MKKPGFLTLSFSLLLILFSSFGYSQDYPTLNNTYFKANDGREVIEVFKYAENSDLLGFLDELYFSKSGELLVLGYNNFVRMSPEGDILSVNKRIISNNNVFHNDILYFHSEANNKHYLQKYNSSGCYLGRMALTGGQAPFRGQLLVDNDDNFVFIDPDYEETKIVKFSKNGSYLNSFSISQPESFISPFVINKANQLVGWCSNNNSMITFDPDGNELSRFQVTLKSKYYTSVVLRLNQNDELVLYEVSTSNVNRFNQQGDLLSQATLKRKNGKKLNGWTFFVDADGCYYYFDYSDETLEKFGADGNYLKTIITRKTVVLPTKILNKNKDIYASWALDMGSDGNLYSLNKNSNKVNLLSPSGRLIKTINLSVEAPWSRKLVTTPDGGFALATEEEIYFFSKTGKLKTRLDIEAYLSGFDVDSKGFIYTLTIENPYALLSRFNSEGEKLYSKNLGSEFMFSIKAGPDKQVHIITRENEISVFSKTGKFLRKFNTDLCYVGLNFNKEGNYVLHKTNGFSIADKKGNILADYSNGMLESYGNIVQDQQGRYYFPTKAAQKIITFNPDSTFNASGKTGRIRVKIKNVKNLENLNYYYTNIYLEAVTPAGDRFFGIRYIYSDYYYADFPDIPLNSTYRIWLDDPGLDKTYVKNPVITGKLTKRKMRAIMRCQQHSSQNVSIYGVVKNKAGIGINGVEIKCGEFSTVTTSCGQYRLLVPANSDYTITAVKAGYSFRKSQRSLSVGENDKLYVNFNEK